MGLANPSALLALSAIIPLILAYLLKPKPVDFAIPSLMFISKMQKQKTIFNSFFNKLVKDPLFLIQLLVLILLAIIMAQPFIMLDKNLSAGHTVIVLDASASMKADNRFDDAKSKAGDYLSRKVSIVVSENVPIKVLESGSSKEAKSVIAKLQAKDTTSGISDAMLLGERILADGGGRIVVLSDFSSFDGEKPWATKQKLEASGIDVALVSVGKGADNIGIIGTPGVEIQPYQETYEYNTIIKNFMDTSQKVPVEVKHDGKTIATKTYTIPARSSEYFSLQNVGEGVTTVSLNVNDDLESDNTAYIYIPSLSERRVLYTSETAKAPSKTVLSVVSRTDVKEISPDIFPRDFSDYDLVVIGNISAKGELTGSLPAGTFDEYLYEYVSGGGDVVVVGSAGLSSYKVEKLLPVHLGGVSNKKMDAKMVLQNEFAKKEYFDDVTIPKHLLSIPARDSVVLVNSTDDSVVLAYKKIGAGTVVYLGLTDDATWSNFHLKSDYPVFWIKLIDWLSGVGDISQFNKNTGTMIQPGRDITRPDGVVTKSNLLDMAGMYEMGDVIGSAGDGKIAVNLYNEKESDLTMSEVSGASNYNSGTSRSGSNKVRTELEGILIALVAILVFVELYVIKKRREL